VGGSVVAARVDLHMRTAVRVRYQKLPLTCFNTPSYFKRLTGDDPKMRALEAYIMAQRKGVAMEYGKH